jgi:hypothetical protein
MSKLECHPRVPHRRKSGFGSALLAPGGLVAIAVTILFVALIGANRTIPTSPATHPHPASTYTPPNQYRVAGRCHAVLNPITGELHGGCAPATPTSRNTPTPAP